MCPDENRRSDGRFDTTIDRGTIDANTIQQIQQAEAEMKIRNPELSRKDWQLCCTYVEEMRQRGLSAYEPWELELEAWAANPDRQPGKSTVTKLRLRFPIHT
jgi:hypothetical protein